MDGREEKPLPDAFLKNRLIVLLLPLLAACSPHPGAGNWKAREANEPGISAITLSYEGRAQFASKVPPALWHCFWSARGKREIDLTCTPSTNPHREAAFRFRVDERGQGTLEQDGKPVARFLRVAGPPLVEQ